MVFKKLKLTEADAIRLTLAHVESLFPKTCNKCNKVFENYREYLLNTERAGVPLSYDIELDNWTPINSSGNVALANCRCGNTLAISSHGMPLMQIWQILNWVRIETKKRGVKTQDIMCYLRDEVEKNALIQK